MNALELANWIENGAPFGKYETAKQAVVMLRQQQAEIETYKLELYNEVMLRREQNNIYKQQIENMGLAIADSGYTWTPAMRSAWEALDKEPK